MNIETKILEVLAENPRGLTYSAIARKIGKTSATVSTYCRIMKERGEVDIMEVGKSRLVTISSEVRGEKIPDYTVIFEPQHKGGFTATVPALPGCISEGDTLDEARRMISDAIRAYCESLRKDGKPLPKDVKTIKEKIKVSPL